MRPADMLSAEFEKISGLQARWPHRLQVCVPLRDPTITGAVSRNGVKTLPLMYPIRFLLTFALAAVTLSAAAQNTVVIVKWNRASLIQA